MKLESNYIDSSYANNASRVTNRVGKDAEKRTVVEKKNAMTHYDARKQKSKEDIEKELNSAVEKANNHFRVHDRKFEISVHEKTKRIAVKVLDAETDEVIREIPTEKMLDLIAEIWEVAGIAIDKRV